ncbi:MAG: hypothetical protein ABMB14_20600 [Myxococcota bacterium]
MLGLFLTALGVLPTGLAWAAPPGSPDDAAEEIIVYGDDFARWDHTRWSVQTELVFPLGITFASDKNLSFRSYAFQVHAVIGCDKDAKLSKKRWEVSCTIEDIGLLVTTQRNWRREKDRALVQTVIDEIDAKLTGIDVQMQVAEDGAVTNFDLEGIRADNERERSIQESLRQVMSRTMAGFHLKIPDHGQHNGQWVEYNSELMDLPSLTSSRGSTTLVHQVSPYQGMQLVQTVGQGTVSVALPAAATTAFSNTAPVDDGSSVVGSVGEGTTANADDPEEQNEGGGESELEVTYAMQAQGVAVFDKANGIMRERVWVVTGSPTAGSGGGVNTPPFRSVGRIQLLDPTAKPEVGATKQVAWPGRKMEGLDPWVGLESP